MKKEVLANLARTERGVTSAARVLTGGEVHSCIWRKSVLPLPASVFGDGLLKVRLGASAIVNAICMLYACIYMGA